MGYHTLLVIVGEEEGLDRRLETARLLAQRFDAHVIGLHVLPPPLLPVGYGEAVAYVGPDLVEAQRRAQRRRAEQLKARFSELLGELAPAVAWREVEGDPRQVTLDAAHVADLTLVPQTEDRGLEAIEPNVAEYLAMGAGGPVLVLPRCDWSLPVGRRILVGWNGSRQACRALHDALPLMAGAEQVVLAALGDAAQASLEDALGLLARHGVEARGLPLAAAARPGAALLEQVREQGADLLVMGAYGHSRLRELILGGTTRYVLQRAQVPVLASS